MLSNQQARSVAATLKRRLLEAPKATQRRYVRGLVSNIVVNRELAVITGPQAAIASYASNPDTIPMVPGLVREWRTRHMWTAPSSQEGFTVSDQIACFHMSGLLIALTQERWPRWFPRREFQTR